MIEKNRIGVLIIGQTPRTDLMVALDHLHDRCDFQVRGALDAIQKNEIPENARGAYPLVTRLKDGSKVTVDEEFLTPLLQQAIDDLEKEGVTSILLLCAGPFNNLKSTVPLIRPFQLAALVVKKLGMQQVLIVVPTNDQHEPAQTKWEETGLDPIVISAERKPTNVPLEVWLTETIHTLPNLTALILDYVGHPTELLSALRTTIPYPIVDLGHLAVAITEAMLAPRNEHTPI